MLRKRIIFTLIYADGFFHQSRNFRLQRVGNINWLENNYKFKDIAFSLDELIVLNASKKEKNFIDFAKLLSTIVNDVFIPIAAGGGIRSLEDAKTLFDNGADKIVLNSSLFENKKLVEQLVSRYGSQSLVASIDYKKNEDKYEVYINDGTKKIDIPLREYIEYVLTLNVGEIYLNSIDKDGTGFGYDLSVIEDVSKNITIPLIVAGGAGNEKHLIEGLEKDCISAVATANLFNFIGDGLPNARKKIINNNFNLAKWE